MSNGWIRTTKILTTLALAAFGAFSIGCGPAPGYEPEPRMPVGYVPAPAEPLTSEELAAQNEARAAQATGEIAVGADTEEYADTDPSALTEFKPALEGHGAWVDDATYGTLWVPSEAEVGTDFVPYTTAGHWTYDDETSWVWVSDYAWGWAPFHYGRWVNVSRHGWAWIPGRTYAGAWVSWRTGAGYDYVGWSPMGPDWYWYNGYAVGWTYGYSPSYSYCHHDHLYTPGVSRHVVRGEAAREHEGRTRPYVAANPSVGGGGRVAAAPTVGGGGRVAANPSVGGGRVAAAPTVGDASARALANPRVGPRPSELGVRSGAVVAPPRDDAGLARARVLSSPHSAVAQGAAPPVGVRRRPSTDTMAVAPSRHSFDSRGPITSSHEAVARGPSYQGIRPVPPRQASLPPTRPTVRSFSTESAYGPPPSARPSYGVQPPAFRSQPRVAAQAPAYRAPAPRISPPTTSFRTSPSPSFRSTSPSSSFRSSPSPSFRSSPSPSFRSSPSPSFRSSPSPSFRSSPSPSFRSSPRVSPSVRSAPSPRVSSPSRSSGAAIRRSRR
jgi:hypothetical protein